MGTLEEFIQQITLFPRARFDDLADAMSQASIWLQQHQPRGEGAPVCVLRQDRIDAARALMHPVTGYERGTAAQGGWNVEHEPSPAAAAASTRIAHGCARDGDLETVAFDSIREMMGND